MVGNTNAMTFKINPVVNLTILMQRRKTQYIKVQLHNSNLPTDNPSSADDKNPVNQGSDATDNSNLPNDNSSEGDESNGNSDYNWSSADPVLYVFQFNENERMKIDVPAYDIPVHLRLINL